MSEAVAPPAPIPALSAGSTTTNAERFARGWTILAQIGGADFDLPLRKLAQVAPDLARFTVEFAYGDVLSRPGLDLPLRQVVTVASLLAHGRAERQLRYHMDGMLNVGVAPIVLVELLYLAIVLLGFPITINAIPIVRTIFSERNVDVELPTDFSDDGTARYARGVATLATLLRHPDEYSASLAAKDAAFARWTIEFQYGEIFARPGLDVRTRQLAVIAMLATVGDRDEQLRLHLVAGLRHGLSATEITEGLVQLAVYAGFPTALNALGVAMQVFTGEDVACAAREPSMMQATAPIPSESYAMRRARGLTTLAVTSAQAGHAVVNSFDDVAPAIGRAIVEHAYADIFARPGIDLRTRELSACAAFAAVGTPAMATPLRVHVNAALRTGASEEEIIEVLLNLIPHCGYPTVEKALGIAREVFDSIASKT